MLHLKLSEFVGNTAKKTKENQQSWLRDKKILPVNLSHIAENLQFEWTIS